MGTSVGANIRGLVKDNAAGDVWHNVGDIIRTNVWANVRSRVVDNVQNVKDSVEAAIRDNTRNSVKDSAGASVRASVWDSFYGQHDAAWLAYYKFFNDVCGLKLETAPLSGLWEIAESAGWWMPHAKLCWVCERPCHLTRDSRGQLHNESRQAIEYPDGWGVWALHGVRVPKELVTTDWDALDVAYWVVKQSNAEIRREAVRKIGIERVCQQLGARVLDAGFDQAGQPCELLALDLGDGRIRPYIKLRHPGIGTYHVEGVHPECRTIESAFLFRNSRGAAPAWLR